MYIIAFDTLLSYERSQNVLAFSHIKRNTDDQSGSVLPTIVVPVIFASVFIPLFVAMYRSWKWEKANILKNQQTQDKDKGNDGRSDKAELSSGASVIISEMDSQQETQELSERKDGLPHEMLGATALPQELPGDLHEMPAGDCKNKSEEAK
ncbi:hypothetical protein F5Y12DRAFT_758501 [Xylaria sp. FL1777]|nr:hypothetical protein F5Y12DRAFT_758501 [Xylaria sp. FL1777]